VANNQSETLSVLLEQLPEFPNVKMTDKFFKEISGLIPVKPSEDQTLFESETIFRKWLQAVRTHYPKICKDKKQWLLASWILFVEYGNMIWDSPISGTEYRKGTMRNLVDRFNQAFQKAQEIND